MIIRIVLPLCLSLGMALAAAPPPKAKAGDPAKGKAIFGEQCAVCHSAETTERKMGPGLRGLFKHAKLAGGQKVTDQTVRQKIDNGGNGMPAFKDMLSEQERENLVAYLKSL